MATFGNTNAEASGGALLSMVGCKFTAPDSGTVTDINVYILDYFSDTAMTVAIYDDSGGSPNNRLATGTPITVTSTGWKAVSISASITSGAVYWLVAWAETSNINTAFKTPGDVTNQTAFQSDQTYPTWPATFTEAGNLDRTYSYYATYTPEGVAIVPPMVFVRGKRPSKKRRAA